MLGYSREELVGQPLKRIAHPGISAGAAGRHPRHHRARPALARHGINLCAAMAAMCGQSPLIIPVLQARRSHRLYVDPQRGQPAAHRRRRTTLSRHPRWRAPLSRRTRARLDAGDGVSPAGGAGARPPCRPCAPACCSGRRPGWPGAKGGLAALAGDCWLLTLLSARWLGRRTLRAGRHHWPFSSHGEGDLSHEIQWAVRTKWAACWKALAVMQGHLQVLLDSRRGGTPPSKENLALLADIDAWAGPRSSGWTKWRSCAPSAPTIWRRWAAPTPDAQACAEAAARFAGAGGGRASSADHGGRRRRRRPRHGGRRQRHAQPTGRRGASGGKMSALIGDIAAQNPFAGAERRHRSRPRGRVWPGICRGGRRSAQAGRAHQRQHCLNQPARRRYPRGQPANARHSIMGRRPPHAQRQRSGGRQPHTVAAMAGIEAMSARVGQDCPGPAAHSEAVTVTRQQVETAQQNRLRPASPDGGECRRDRSARRNRRPGRAHRPAFAWRAGRLRRRRAVTPGGVVSRATQTAA